MKTIQSKASEIPFCCACFLCYVAFHVLIFFISLPNKVRKKDLKFIAFGTGFSPMDIDALCSISFTSFTFVLLHEDGQFWILLLQ